MHLTDAGRRFREAVARSLDTLRTAIREISERPDDEQVVVACSHDNSHFFLMPRHNLLQEALGEKARVRILTYHYDLQPLLLDSVADVVLAWAASFTEKDRVTVLEEAVRAVCSPGYAATHQETLDGPVSGWGGLMFLNPVQANQGWASWEDWFDAAGHPEAAPRYMEFDSYTYVLEAAAAGVGVALGWRGYIERHLETGALIGLSHGFAEFDNRLCAGLTEKGRRNPLAYRCLEFLAQQA